MKFNVDCITKLISGKNKINVFFCTDWRTLENAGYDIDSADFSFSISYDGELLEWDGDFMEHQYIPDSWHDMKCICDGSISDEKRENDIAAEDIEEAEEFYNLCNNVLNYCKEQDNK